MFGIYLQDLFIMCVGKFNFVTQMIGGGEIVQVIDVLGIAFNRLFTINNGAVAVAHYVIAETDITPYLTFLGF